MKLKVLSLVMIASLLVSMVLMIGIGSAQYSTAIVPPTGPEFVLELPSGTQDMNVSGTGTYAVGKTFTVTAWIDNVTAMDGFGFSMFWNASLMSMTGISWSPGLTAQVLAGNWSLSALTQGVEWTNNATRMIGKPWSGVIPINVGAVLGIGGTSLADICPLTGNIELCTMTFVINMLGAHWFYIDKDPSNYGANPANWPTPYLMLEALYAGVHFPYCLVEVTPGDTPTNYGVVWSSNPYFAPPTLANPYMPYSGYVFNAVLVTMPPPPTAVTAVETVSPSYPSVGQTVTVTVTTTPGLYLIYTFPVTNVTINWGDGTWNWTVPIANVATFHHAYATSGLKTINEYCVAAGMVPYFPTLAWANISSTVTVMAKIVSGIDVYEVRESLWPGDINWTISGIGPGTPGRPYAPQDLVHLEANVTYNGAPVQEQIVTFEVHVEYPVGYPVNMTILIVTAMTNATGYADIEFRIPNLCAQFGGPQALMGKWWVYVDVAMCQVKYSDYMFFDMGYILTLSNMVAVTGASPSSPLKVCQYINFTVSVTNIDWASAGEVPAYVVLVIYDNNEVPIGYDCITMSFPGETIFCHPVTTTFQMSLHIPKYAFVGQSIGYINLFTNIPSLCGLPYCPEVSASFFTAA
jgi:hypothetical protein